jgi:RecT family protein
MSNLVTLQQDEAPPAIPTVANSVGAMILNDSTMDRIERVAKMMAGGRATVPKHLQGNVGDCFAVCLQAMNWQMDPFAVGQKTHLVNGTLGYEAQLVNAVITTRAPVTGRIEYQWFGTWEKILGKFSERESKTKKDDNGYPVKYRVPAWKVEDEDGLGVKVWATFKGESKPRELVLLMTQARTRNSTLWADDPRQQLAYLAVKRWSRLYCPDVIMGVYTPDELEDDLTEINMGAAEVVDQGQKSGSRTEALKERMGVGKDKGKKAATPAPPPAVTLTTVLEAIAAMTGDKATRDHAKGLAEKLTDEGDIAKATDAWKARVEAIKAAATPAHPDPQDEALRQVEMAGRAPQAGAVDAATGEILPATATGETDDFVAAMEREERQAEGGPQ